MTQDQPSHELTIQAHRYLYYVLGTPVLSDIEYDMLEASLPVESEIRQTVGSDRASDYSLEAIMLANHIWAANT